jgi:TolB-like protein/DNA-binding winged helix-turn-helix (wHTH) protein/Tfp pilus assembly protein PilF
MTTHSGNYRFGAYELRTRARELYKHDTKLRLRPQAFQVLKALVERAGDAVTRDELRILLWDKDTFVDFEHGLNAAISELRGVLNDPASEPRYIETLPKVGYRIKAPIELIETDDQQRSPKEPGTEIPFLTPIDSPTEVPVRESPVQKTGGARWVRRLLAASAVAVAVVGLLVLAYVTSQGHPANVPQPKIKSLAVLPLKNLSGDPAQDYLADGMTEALTGRLSGIHDLRVISHTSVMRFRDPQHSAPEIAKTLGVDALVEGSVLKVGNRIRVTAQLIRAATDEHFWSETYDRELGDALTLQSELAQSIAKKVEVSVTGTEHQRLTASRPVAAEVYESYLKGRFTLDNSNNRTGIEESIGYFQDAVNRDPTFAPAYLGLAEASNDLGTVFIGIPPQEVRRKVINAARKAIELDPDLVESHVLLADVQKEQWHWAEAEAEYRRALELNPSSAAAHAGLASWMLCQGRLDEALAWSRRGRQLDPLSVSGIEIGWILFDSRRNEEAASELRSVLAVHPDNAVALWYLGFVLIAKNQPEDAIQVLEKAASVSNRSPGVIGVLIRAYAQAGRRSDALRLLAELQTRRKAGYVPTGAFVNAYLGLGENEQAFAWLEQAYKEQSNILQFLKVHPYFDPLRADPRFEDLVRRVGLA